MKLSKLLTTRHNILRQAHLAALGHAYFTVQRLAERIARAKIRGMVRLQPAAPAEERYCATLLALEASQAVIEEHFTDPEIMDLTDAILLVLETDYAEVEFRIEELGEKFGQPLRTALDRAGVTIDLDGKRQPRLARDA